MTIHFVCKGNTYRSRLAETYLNSKQLPEFKATSSGIEAERNISGPIGWYTQRIIQRNHLVPYEKSMWDQTTRDLLKKADFTVFMNQDIYDYCTKDLGFSSKNFEVWDVPDTGPTDPRWKEATEDEKISITENTFVNIKEKIDQLIGKLNLA